MKKIDYIIIGAGITGLTVAEQLCNKSYLVIEKEDHIGGYCASVKKDKYVWDYAGHFFHFKDKDELELFKKKFSTSEYKKVKKNTKIVYKDKMITYPFQNNLHELEENEYKECILGLKNRVEKLEYVSFLDMLYSQYGIEIVGKFLRPYNEKLYACDLNELDADAMGRFFPPIHTTEDVNKTYNDEFFYLYDGAEQYVRKLTFDKNKVIMNCMVDSLDIENKILITSNGVKYKYNILISTIPLKTLINMCGIISKTKMTCNKVLVFNIGFDKKTEIHDVHWLYVPDKDINFYRVGFYDNIASSDKGSLYVEVAFAEDQTIDPEVEFDSIIKGLRKIGIITDQKVVVYDYVIMDHAYVHIINQRYINELRQKLRKHNIFTIGRYGGWTYNSMEDCIIEAKETVKEILTCEI